MRLNSNVANCVLALLSLAGFHGQALANGHIDAKNCSNSKMGFCTYDWADSVQYGARQLIWIDAGGTDGASCRKSWSDPNAPGCGVGLFNTDSCANPAIIGRFFSRSYTIWSTGGGDTANFMISRGVASDCQGGLPTQFTLTGTEISGCSEPPKVIRYESPDKSGASWVLENASMHDMTREQGGSYTGSSKNVNMYDLNDRIRALELRSGHWEICEDIEYGGKCLDFYSKSPTTVRLDTGWSGNWDRKISSVRPKACQ
ncbi:MAG: hypothetical protein ABI972_21590 [Acidobacteriota bacterium]